MLRASLLLSVSSILLVLGGCAGMDGPPSIIMEQSASRPPPLPIAVPKAPLKAKAKREAVPVPTPRPVPDAPPVVQAPPHKWYDHLKFWQK